MTSTPDASRWWPPPGQGTRPPSPHPISLDEFIPRWQKRMQTWRAWMCTQTKQTLQQVRQGTPHHRLGGNSNAMALRHLGAQGGRIDSDGAKLIATTMSKEVADNAMQVLGGYGYCTEFKVERFLRDAKLLEIGGGTLESHQKNITRDLTRGS